MKFGQAAALILIAAFYIAYTIKLLRQKRKGIVTNQIAKGNKPEHTQKIEKIMRTATFSIVPVEIISILMDTHQLVSKVFIAAGLAIALLGIALFITAMITMHDSWRAGINYHERTDLIKKGIYRLSRNPAFLGFDLFYIGIFISFANIFHLLFLIFAVTMLHLQILEEEKYLPYVFGEEYLSYKKKTARYFLFF